MADQRAVGDPTTDPIRLRLDRSQDIEQPPLATGHCHLPFELLEIMLPRHLLSIGVSSLEKKLEIGQP